VDENRFQIWRLRCVIIAPALGDVETQTTSFGFIALLWDTISPVDLKAGETHSIKKER
jgi:hypothetical protein